MIDPTDKVLTALYNLLNGITVTPITGTGSLSVPFFTFPPETQSYPYITVSQINVLPDNDKTAYSTEVVVVLDVVTAFESSRATAKQANEIADEILSLVDYKNNLSLTGATNWKVRVEDSQLLSEMAESIRIVRKLIRIRFSIWEG